MNKCLMGSLYICVSFLFRKYLVELFSRHVFLNLFHFLFLLTKMANFNDSSPFIVYEYE